MKMERLLLRVPEAADILGVSKSKLYELVAADRIPGVMRLGSSIRISREALEEWIKSEAAGASWQGQPAAEVGRQ